MRPRVNWRLSRKNFRENHARILNASEQEHAQERYREDSDNLTLWRREITFH